jgi:uncharacterized protein YndB with AHSA1/START domain
MSNGAGLVLRIERTFDAPVEEVFAAWTSEEVMRRWWYVGDIPEDVSEEVDVRVGGKLRLVVRSSDGDVRGGRGEYVEVDPPRRLAYTWRWDHEPRERQLVEVEFSDQGEATKVILTNSGFKTEERRDAHAEGWPKCFDLLERALAG